MWTSCWTERETYCILGLGEIMFNININVDFTVGISGEVNNRLFIFMNLADKIITE